MKSKPRAQQLGIALGLLLIIGFSPLPNLIFHGPPVATGIGAKLLCSAEYVMGSNRQQAFEDVAQYSPILGKLSVRYDDSLKGVTTSLLGITEATAVFKEGIGCAIEYPDVVARYQVTTRPLQTSGEP